MLLRQEKEEDTKQQKENVERKQEKDARVAKQIEEDKRNYIENQDSKFLEGIKNEEYLDPKTGEKTKIKDLLSLNDYNKYKNMENLFSNICNKIAKCLYYLFCCCLFRKKYEEMDGDHTNILSDR